MCGEGISMPNGEVLVEERVDDVDRRRLE